MHTVIARLVYRWVSVFLMIVLLAALGSGFWRVFVAELDWADTGHDSGWAARDARHDVRVGDANRP